MTNTSTKDSEIVSLRYVELLNTLKEKNVLFV